MFAKAMRLDKAKPELVGDRGALRSDEGQALPPVSVPVMDSSNQVRERERAIEPRSVVEGTTRKLNDRS
jgi:hypothetical protein